MRAFASTSTCPTRSLGENPSQPKEIPSHSSLLKSLQDSWFYDWISILKNITNSFHGEMREMATPERKFVIDLKEGAAII